MQLKGFIVEFPFRHSGRRRRAQYRALVARGAHRRLPRGIPTRCS